MQPSASSGWSEVARSEAAIGLVRTRLCVVVEWMAAELMARTLLEVNAACCEVALRNRVLAVLMVGELCQE